jgi:hypothetical protein
MAEQEKEIHNEKQKDYSIYKNRMTLGNKMLGLTNNQLACILIRLSVFMEMGNHPNRQAFWEYLEAQYENYSTENQPRQLTLPEQLIDQTTRVMSQNDPKPLDKP